MNNFTGEIICYKQIIKAINATFEIDKDKKFNWEFGAVDESVVLTGLGDFMNFTGNFKFSANGREAFFHATNAAFSTSILNDKPFIRWKGGTWNNGKWINGIWEKGTWENGVWDFGWWSNGKWIRGKDINNIEYTQSPDHWNGQLKRDSLDHYLGKDPYYIGVGQDKKENPQNHKERIDFFKYVARIQPDDNIFITLTNDEETQIDILFNNGFYLVAELNKNQRFTHVGDGEDKIDLWDTLSNKTNVPFTFDFYQKVKYKLLKGSLSKVVDGFDVYRSENWYQIKLLTHPRPAVIEIPDSIFMHSFELTMQRMYIPAQVKQIKDFASNPKYKQIWNEKMKDLEEKKKIGGDDFENLFKDVCAIQGIYAVFCAADKTSNVSISIANEKDKIINEMFSFVKDEIEKKVLEFNIFKSKKEWSNWLNSDDKTPQSAYEAYFKMLKDKDVWS